MLIKSRVTIPGDRPIAGYRYPEIGMKKTLFYNISAKTKIFWGVTLGPRYFCFMKKTRVQKSHATVPLTPPPPTFVRIWPQFHEDFHMFRNPESDKMIFGLLFLYLKKFISMYRTNQLWLIFVLVIAIIGGCSLYGQVRCWF